MYKYMNTASFELCKELFERSGWDDIEKYWLNQDRWQVGHLGEASEETYPAYDLGYLLRKLYACGPVLRCHLDLEARPDAGRDRYFIWVLDGNIDIRLWADTPEDAAARLAIELFKRTGER